MLELAKKYKCRSLRAVSGFIWVLVFCCQQSHAATIYSPDSSIWANDSIAENIGRAAQIVQVNYSAGLMLLPEWELESGENLKIATVKSAGSSIGDISLTVAKINLQVARAKPLENLQLDLADCSSDDLACDSSNAFPLTALAWLFAPGIFGLIGVQRRVWGPENVLVKNF